MPKVPSYDDGFFNAGRQYFELGLPAWKEFVLNDLAATSLADFGCGQGDWLEPFKDIIPIWGCDYGADENCLRIGKVNFRKLDLTLVDPKALDVGKRDVVMSLEVMEHLSERWETNFLDCLLSPDPRLVVFSVASGWGIYDPTQFRINRLGERVLGGSNWHMQYGRHHVNCQPVVEVIAKMAKRGYAVDEALSKMFSQLRVVSSKGNRTRYAFASFYRKNTRVYRKMT